MVSLKEMCSLVKISKCSAMFIYKENCLSQVAKKRSVHIIYVGKDH